MSAHTEQSSSDADLEAIASQWFARRDRGLTATEELKLAAWLAEPAHAEVYARCGALWEALPALKQLSPAALAGLTAQRPRRRHRVAPVIWLVGGLAAAAAIALTFTLRTPVIFPRAESQVRVWSAPAGAEERVVLPDGSIVVLHRGSQVAFGDFPAARQVRLLSGEAHFTVAKTTDRPFWVYVGEVAVRDIGTAFNVRLESDRVAVLVTEGLVEVQHRTFDLTSAQAPAAGAPVRLAVREQAVVSTTGPAAGIDVRRPTDAELQETLSWKSRRLSFDRTSLADAAAELNRYNVRQLALADPATGALLIAGSVQSDQLDSFVRLLESGFGVAAEQRGAVIVLQAGK